MVMLAVPDAGLVEAEAAGLGLELSGDGTCRSDFSLTQAGCRSPASRPELYANGSEFLRGRVSAPRAALSVSGVAPAPLKARWVPYPAGNFCEQPVALKLDGGVARHSVAIGSTLNLCDKAFWFTLEAAELSIASTTVQCSTQVATVKSAPSCPTSEQGRECSGATSAHGLQLLPAGTHRFLARGDGQCLITAQVQPAAVGESCLKPATLTTSVVDAGVEGATLSAETGGHVAEGSVPCAAGPDVAYRFTLSQPRDVTARVTTTDAAFKPALALWKDKCSGTAAACAAASLAGAGAEVTVTAAPAGEYFVAVGGENGGPFTLQVTLK